jgi:hypothetical protein
MLQGSDEGVVFQPHPAVLASYKQVYMHAHVKPYAIV